MADTPHPPGLENLGCAQAATCNASGLYLPAASTAGQACSTKCWQIKCQGSVYVAFGKSTSDVLTRLPPLPHPSCCVDRGDSGGSGLSYCLWAPNSHSSSAVMLGWDSADDKPPLSAAPIHQVLAQTCLPAAPACVLRQQPARSRPHFIGRPHTSLGVPSNSQAVPSPWRSGSQLRGSLLSASRF